MPPSSDPTLISNDLFLGREAELAELAARFDAGARLVTLAGPAGVGKTRLAMRFVREHVGARPGSLAGVPVRVCNLVAARSVDELCDAVVRALAVPVGATVRRRDTAAQIGAHLARS